MTARRRVVPLDGTGLRLHEWGPAPAAPIVCLHHLGLSGTGAAFGEVAPLLADAGPYRVIAPDLPGFGGSPALSPESYDPGRLAGLVEALLDELGIQRAVVLGFSWGGTIGARLALRAPSRVAALGLLDSGYVEIADDEGFDAMATLGDRIAELRAEEPAFHLPDAAALEGFVRGRARRSTTAVLQAYRENFTVRGDVLAPRITAEAFASVLHHAAVTPLRPLLPDLGRGGVPVLLFAATEPPDATGRRQRLLDAFVHAVPQAEVVHATGCGHDVLNELGPRLVAPLLRWLRWLEAAR